MKNKNYKKKTNKSKKTKIKWSIWALRIGCVLLVLLMLGTSILPLLLK